MKICFFLSDITKVGGIERVTSTLVSQLIEFQDINIDIVSMFKGREFLNYSIPDTVSIKYLIQKKHGAKPHSFGRAITMFSNLAIVRNFFINSDYDIVIAQSFPIALSLFLSGYPPKKIIAVEHVFAGYYNRFVQIIRFYVYSKMRQIVVLTKADKLFFEKGLPSEHIKVIPNPVRKIDTIYAPLTNKKIISVGRLEYQKGYDNLIKGFAELHSKYPDWELNIYGEGSLRNSLQRQINKLGLKNVVNLCGLTDDIDSKLEESAFFVMPSRFEGFGMVLVEAMSHGVPCISYDCPNGPSDIIKNGHNGLLVENQNLSALMTAIESLIKDPIERKRLGHNAPESISCFSESVIAQKWYELFISICK